MQQTPPEKSSKRWADWWQRGLLWSLVLIGCAAAWYAYRGFVFDDAYITYRYSQNLVLGRGFVFNPGERVLGTSSPLYTLLLAVLGWLGLPIAESSEAVFFLGLAALALVGARIARDVESPAAGWLFAGLVVVGFGGVRAYLGLETTLYAALGLGAVLASLRGRKGLSGLLLGLCFLTRYDGALLALLVLGWQAWRDRHIPWRAGLTALATVLPWLLFAWLYFGSVLPNTLAAKAGDAGPASYLATSAAAQIDRALVVLDLGDLRVPRVVRALALLLLAGGIFAAGRGLLREEPALVPLFVFPLALWVAYGFIGPPPQHTWHLAPAAWFLLLFACLSAQRVLRGLHSRARLALVALGLLLFGLTPGVLEGELRLLDNADRRTRRDAYREMARYLRHNRLGDLRILTLEPGYLAYLSDNPMIDAAGLVTPGIFFHGPAERREGMRTRVERLRPDAVVTHNGELPDFTFDGYVRMVESFTTRALVVRSDRVVSAPERFVGWPAPTDALPGDAVESEFVPADVERWREQGGWVPGARTLDWLPEGDRAPPDVGETWHGHSKTDGIESPEVIVDFDELRFRWGANDPLFHAAQLVVEGRVVAEVRGARGSLASFREVVFPTLPWRGRPARLRFVDLAPQGSPLVVDWVRVRRHREVRMIDDFERERLGEDWPEVAELPTADLLSLMARHGRGILSGEGAGATLGLVGEWELRSRPFSLDHDLLAFRLLDFVDGRGRVSLEVDGRVVRAIRARRRGFQRWVHWGVEEWQGREAVLVIEDRARAPNAGVGIDDLHQFDSPN